MLSILISIDFISILIFYYSGNYKKFPINLKNFMYQACGDLVSKKNKEKEEMAPA